MGYLTATLLAALITSVAAKDSRTFAVNHFYGQGPLVMGRIDPIISPGKTSGHVHAIQGGNKMAFTLEDDTLLSSTCTSSLVKNDKSDYWTPALYFQDPVNGSFINVPMFYMNVYYFFEATDDEIKAFQPGHRMVIGNPFIRSPPATGGKSITDTNYGVPQPVQWTCPRTSYSTPSYPADSDGLHGVGIQDPNNQGAGVGFPDENCDGYASPLRADVHFPSCYNPAVGLDDYENNMAWPSSAGTTGGKANCPEGYIHTPHLFYEVYWNTPLFKDMWTPGQGKQPFVLACGDPTGYGLHGDFVSGWDVDTLQQIIDNCDAGDSGMDKCPGLIGGLNDPSTSCNIPDPNNEQISGVLAALPGNNPLTGWGSSVGSGIGSNSSSSAVSSMAAASSASGSASSVAASSVASASASGYGSVSASSAATGYSSVPSSWAASAAASSDSGSAVAEAPSSAIAATSSGSSAMGVAATSGSGSSGWSSPVGETETGVAATSTSGSSGWISPVSETEGSPCGIATVETTVTVLSTITVTPSKAAATTAASSSNTTTSSTPVESGWSSAGCHSDVSSNRVLQGITFANLGQGKVTTTGCVSYCDSKGFSMAGTEYGGQCFCGNSLGEGSQPLDASSCSMPCEGDGSQICGGSMALSVYEKAASSKRRRSHLRRHLRDHKGM